jgi:hypothetical protein
MIRVGLWVLGTAAIAGAAPSPADRAAAEVLFREAKALMGKNQFPPACRKLEESQRLDPQGGTLLNLAVCHAREGRTASAWVEFQEAIEAAKQVERADRVKLAQKELKLLDGKLAQLTIEVPEEARVPGLKIERGDDVVGEGAWGSAVPVDPGIEVSLRASAPGYRAWATRVSLKTVEQKTIVVPKLEKLPPPPAKPKPKPIGPNTEQLEKDRKTKRMIAYVAGGTGLVAVGIGSYFGLRAITKKKQSEEHCNGSLCDPEGLELNDRADRAATVANVAFGVGLVGLGVGTYFYLTSMPEKSPNPSTDKGVSVRVAPAGIQIAGAW